MAKRSRKDRFNNRKDTWDPSENKGQMSLALGSDEYEAYVEDQRRNAPDRPDDKDHLETEEHNVEIREEMEAETVLDRDETTAMRKFRRQQENRAMAAQVKKDAVRAAAAASAVAALTPDKADDARAAALRKKASQIRLDREPVIRSVYDDGVTKPEEMDDAFGKDLDDLLPH